MKPPWNLTFCKSAELLNSHKIFYALFEKGADHI